MAAEIAAELLLGPVVDALISKVAEQLNLAMGFKQELERFRDTLDMVRGFLGYAEQKGLKDRPDLKRWLERLRSIAEEADDVMDEIAYENLRQKVEVQGQKLKQVSYFFTPSNPIAFRHKMAKKIKNLNAALDALNTRATELGLQRKLENMSPKPRRIRQTDSFSIVGMAGLGKTTLAKLACNNDQMTVERIFAAINFLLELPSVVLDQLSSGSKPLWALMLLLLSCVALVICIIELVCNSRMVPRRHLRKNPFCSFSNIVGLISAFCQCIFTMVNYAMVLQHRNIQIKISVMPIVFAFVLLCSKFCSNPKQTKSEVELA